VGTKPKLLDMFCGAGGAAPGSGLAKGDGHRLDDPGRDQTSDPTKVHRVHRNINKVLLLI